VILAGDIGGTHTTLALCDDHGAVVREQVFPSADFPSLEAVVARFVPAPAEVSAACFGVAGPVVDGTAHITNLPWRIDARELGSKLGGVRVALLNDLQATAYGVLALPADAFAVLQPPQDAAAAGPIAVIAPGTGLGEAVIVPAGDGAGHRVLPSEGGHADFAPGTDEEVELWRHLRARHGDHVSYERVLSGNGIGDLYGFARARSDAPEPAWLTAQLADGDRNAAIAQAGLAGTDPACVHALALFAAVLGAEAGNLALRAFAGGGVVIAGGIPPKVLPALQTGALVARFNLKGRFDAWTRTLGVRVALEPRAALLGAIHVAIAREGST
jgi:glucokinase